MLMTPKRMASTITGNFAGGQGGGIYTHASSPRISASTFANNRAHSGAALYGRSGNPTVSNSTITVVFTANINPIESVLSPK